MKTKFILLNGAVSISYDDQGVRVNREFICPIEGGYVRERVGNDFGNGYRQVCRKLSTRGDTLMSTRDSLLADIRREYRAMKRAEKSI
jgi:hypothetical protein